jgi:hypothetical protein
MGGSKISSSLNLLIDTPPIIPVACVLNRLKKSWDDPEDYITYENGKLMYGTSTKKEVPSSLATPIKNGYKENIKFVEDQIKNLPKEDKEKQVQSEFGNYNNILAYVDVVKKDAEELKLTS